MTGRASHSSARRRFLKLVFVYAAASAVFGFSTGSSAEIPLPVPTASPALPSPEIGAGFTAEAVAAATATPAEPSEVSSTPEPEERPRRSPETTTTEYRSDGPKSSPRERRSASVSHRIESASTPTPDEPPISDDSVRSPALPAPSGDGSALGPATLEDPERIDAPSFVIPSFPRTRGRSTTKLVELLAPLAEHLPIDQVLIEGMGRFPVAGRAHYSDDWLNPRYTPTFHLHKGLDIFAASGTPVRAPEKGVVVRFSNNPAGGGIGLWLEGSDGTLYYFAHLRARAEGLRPAADVDVGDVLGYVGDTGNARGGAPHLHLEMHEPGPVPPKPAVDRWLDEAEALAPAWVAERLERINQIEPPKTVEPEDAPAVARDDARAQTVTGTAPATSDRAAEATTRGPTFRDHGWAPAALEIPMRTPGQLLVILGGLLVAWALAWRMSASWLATRRLRTALEDPDPSIRMSAVEVATAQGLTRYAGPLADLVRRETSTPVLAAVADAVGRNLWEPGDNPRVIELRLWADRWRRQPLPAPASTNGHTPSKDGDPLACLTVLVTGAGGPAGVSVIRALRERCRVIAADADPLAAGLSLASSAEVIPAADDPDFLERLLKVADKTEADALVPTLTEEMLVLARHQHQVAEQVAMWLAPIDSLELCQDKWRFAAAMREAGVSVPPTALGSTDGIPGPWVVKPRFSRGSRDVHNVDRADDVATVVRNVDNAIVQSRLRGQEFTVDALVSRTGELVGAVPRWRLETRGGVSTKGRTFSDDRVLEGVAAVVSAIRLRGAANIQGFVEDERLWFLEVNPRFSGGLPLSLAAGADLVGEYIRGVMGLPVRSDRLVFQEGTTMIRHFEEIYA